MIGLLAEGLGVEEGRLREMSLPERRETGEFVVYTLYIIVKIVNNKYRKILYFTVTLSQSYNLLLVVTLIYLQIQISSFICLDKKSILKNFDINYII